MNKSTETGEVKGVTVSGPPELSGWIAWWIEEDGYNVVQKHKKELYSVSPGWFKLDKSRNLVEIGEYDKQAIAKTLKRNSTKLYPMIVTDLEDDELAEFIVNDQKLAAFVRELVHKAKSYGVDGLDLDFENISARYTSEFSLLVKTLSDELRKENLHFSVTVQARTGKDDWVGIKGQNLSYIAEVADEVRVMIYDRHGEFSAPGAITPMEWFKDVVDYVLVSVPREKLVLALPTYGYLWFSDGDFLSYQYKEFVSYAEGEDYTVIRDPESHELRYLKDGAEGWLSDSEAVLAKIKYAREVGLNRFALWNLSGTDEEVFNAVWD